MSSTQGTITRYDPEEVEGDIRPDDEDKTIPFYEESLAEAESADRLEEGDRVLFDVTGGMAGIMCTNVRRINE